MENDNEWQALGDVVARILARTEGAIIDRTPIETADAAMFVQLVNGELPGGLATPKAVLRTERQEDAESGASHRARVRSGGGGS